MIEEHKKHPVRYVTDLLCEMVIQLSETKDELSETKQQLEQTEKEKSELLKQYMDFHAKANGKLTELEKEAAEHRRVMGRLQEFIDNHNNMPAEAGRALESFAVAVKNSQRGINE